MRVAIVHSDPDISWLMAQTLRKRFALLNFRLDVVDGREIDHQGVVRLFRQDYDCIFLNLRLPYCLSLRLAEIAHLARVQTRVILVSGTPVADEWLLPFYDDLIRLPCDLDELEDALWRIPEETRQRLPTEEHVEAALSNLLREARYIVPVSTSAEQPYAAYRAVYPLPTPGIFADKLGGLEIKTPVDYRSRLASCLQRVNSSLALPPIAQSVFALFTSQLKPKLAQVVWSAPRDLEQTLNAIEAVVVRLAERRARTNWAAVIEKLNWSSMALPPCRTEILGLVSLVELIQRSSSR
jgi:hypothetical protein